MEGMDITKEDSKKRGRSETSVSEADTSLIEDSKDSKNASQINIDKSNEISPEDVEKDITNAPKNVSKGKLQQQSQRNKPKKARYNKDQKGDEGDWEDLSFQEIVRSQLRDISESLMNVVSKKEIESLFSTFFEKKLEKLMSKMKEEVMRSVNHRIEVLEGDLHDYKDQNEKLMNRVKTLENDLTKKSGAIDKQRKENEKLQTTIQDTDKAFYGRVN